MKQKKMKQKNRPKKQKRNKSKFSIGMKFNLTLAVLIAVSLIVLGTVSIFTTGQTLENNAKSTAHELVEQTSQTVELFFREFEDLLIVFSSNPNVRKSASNDVFRLRVFELMENVYVANENVETVFFMSAEESWLSYPKIDDHDYLISKETFDSMEDSLDITWSAPKKDENGEYYMVVTMPVYNSTHTSYYGVVGIEVNLEYITMLLNNIQLGSRGYPVLIGKDLTTLTHQNSEIVGKPVSVEAIRKAVENEDYSPIDYEYNNEDKFAVLAKAENVDLFILGTMFKDEFRSQVTAIAYTVIIVLGISIAVSVVISFAISRTITKSTNILEENMAHIRQGDLTQKVNVKSKDEIGIIGRHLQETIDAVSSLLKNVHVVSDNLARSAESLASTAEETSASSEDVARTVENIAKGATEQATDADEGAVVARKLSDKFSELSDNTRTLMTSTENVMIANEVGINSMDELKSKSALSDQANKDIELVIKQLNDRTQSISNILNAISSIAEQTNLLALNASIEAARAGEHGRGFTVVAEEIRKLAEESSKSAEEIRDIVSTIQDDSNLTVQSMKALKGFAKEQSLAVVKVNEAFDTISGSIGTITENISSISDNVIALEEDKTAIVSSIENISAVSEETAASAEEVTATMQQQHVAVEEVARAADALNEISIQLKNELNQFKL